MSGATARTGLASMLTALPWCCIAPAAAAFGGVATAGFGAGLARLTPLFLLASVAFIARALYLALVRKHGPLWVRTTVYVSVTLAVALWTFRFGLWP